MLALRTLLHHRLPLRYQRSLRAILWLDPRLFRYRGKRRASTAATAPKADHFFSIGRTPGAATDLYSSRIVHSITLMDVSQRFARRIDYTTIEALQTDLRVLSKNCCSLQQLWYSDHASKHAIFFLHYLTALYACGRSGERSSDDCTAGRP